MSDVKGIEKKSEEADSQPAWPAVFDTHISRTTEKHLRLFWGRYCNTIHCRVVYAFPVLAVTNDHKLRGLKQQKFNLIVPEPRNLKSRCWLSHAPWGVNPASLPAAAAGPRPALAVAAWLLSPPQPVFTWLASLCPFLSLLRTVSLGLWPTLIQYNYTCEDPISKWCHILQFQVDVKWGWRTLCSPLQVGSPCSQGRLSSWNSKRVYTVAPRHSSWDLVALQTTEMGPFLFTWSQSES